MPKERLTAFSDGVIAIIITIMVLEMKAPHHADLASLAALTPVFLSYVLSFLYLAIYWNNHHHLLMAAERVDGAILWANMHLLFWLSLIPFATAWMGENEFASLPVAVYGLALLMPAVAYFILQMAIIRRHGREGTLAKALGADWKGKLSPFAYLAGIVLAFTEPMISEALYVLVALVWLVPDRRIERAIGVK
ncbi:MAG: DUF1211 domain-containing protein [Parvularculaceae bacterium]|nr:DUF1211 domain-containing protein [Parvularculaceae bacterium]